MNTGIEAGRVFSLFAIVLLHMNSLGGFGDAQPAGFLVDELSRFAVPFFFMASAYFWRSDALKSWPGSAWKLLRRLAVPFAVWALLYVGLESSQLLWSSRYEPSLGRLIYLPLTGGPGLHLWFLPALFMGTVLCWAALSKFKSETVMLMAIALYVIAILVWALGAHTGMDKGIYFRNGLLMAPVFLMVGYRFRELKDAPPTKLLIGMLAIGVTLHFIEGFFLWNGYPDGHDIGVGVVIWSAGVFGLFRSINAPEWIIPWGRAVFGAYLIHLLVLKMTLEVIGVRGWLFAMCAGLLVGLLALALSRIARHIPVIRPVMA